MEDLWDSKICYHRRFYESMRRRKNRELETVYNKNMVIKTIMIIKLDFTGQDT